MAFRFCAQLTQSAVSAATICFVSPPVSCAWLIAATYSFVAATAPAFVFSASDASEGVALAEADSELLGVLRQ